MGDSLSPAIAIGTTAWMEMEWMQTLDMETKSRFRAGRFMDDILMVAAEHEAWNVEHLLRYFASSTCYLPPLKLEPADDGCFLETRFVLCPDGQISIGLKI